MSESVSLVAAILFPVLSGAVLLLLKKVNDRRKVLICAGIAMGIAGVLILNALFGKEKEILLFSLTEDIPVVLKLDNMGKWFLAIMSLIWILAGIFSFPYMKHEGKERRYFGFYLITLGAMAGLGCAGNLVTMYAFFEFLTLASFPLVIHNQSREAVMAGLKYLFYSLFGAYMAYMVTRFPAHPKPAMAPNVIR